MELYCYISAVCVPTGILLSARPAAAVYDDVAIKVQWLLQSNGGNFSCKLSTGDGRVIYLEKPEAWVGATVLFFRSSSEFTKFTKLAPQKPDPSSKSLLLYNKHKNMLISETINWWQKHRLLRQMGTWEFKCWKWWELKESTVHDLVLLVKLHYFWIILLLLIYANGLDFKKENDCPLSSLKHGGGSDWISQVCDWTCGCVPGWRAEWCTDTLTQARSLWRLSAAGLTSTLQPAE